MQGTLTRTQTTTKTVRDLITWLSFSGKDIFVREFYELGMDFHLLEEGIIIMCADGKCHFNVRNHFVDALSLVVYK